MSRRAIIGGVDTHASVHCAAIIATTGKLLAVEDFPASSEGYDNLLAWMRSFGRLAQVGVEGTGAYGAGLARCLTAAGIEVLEVPRPDRRERRNHGKSDPIDAEAAARSVLAGRASGAPKGAHGPIEAIRVLRVARIGAIKARTAAVNTLRAMIVSAPEPLRPELPSGGLPNALVNACLRLRPNSRRLEDTTEATKAAIRSLARRAAALTKEIEGLDGCLTGLVAKAAPTTLSSFGLGPDTTSALLVAVGDNPDRLRSEAAFARLCGAAPIPASSGKTRGRVTACIAAATARQTTRSTSRSSCACVTASEHTRTWRDGPPKAFRSQRSSDA
jgi:transposase